MDPAAFEWIIPLLRKIRDQSVIRDLSISRSRCANGGRVDDGLAERYGIIVEPVPDG